MEIKLEVDNELVTLKLIGSLVASTVEDLKVQVAKLIKKKYLFMLLDMKNVDFIDSFGLGACIAIKRDLAVNVGLLACTGLNENVRRVFTMTRADQRIMVFDDRNDAIAALMERMQMVRK